jgi:hypothetical protein
VCSSHTCQGVSRLSLPHIRDTNDREFPAEPPAHTGTGEESVRTRSHPRGTRNAGRSAARPSRITNVMVRAKLGSTVRVWLCLGGFCFVRAATNETVPGEYRCAFGSAEPSRRRSSACMSCPGNRGDSLARGASGHQTTIPTSRKTSRAATRSGGRRKPAATPSRYAASCGR